MKRMYMLQVKFDVTLRASSPIWASEASLAKTCERAAKPRGARFQVNFFKLRLILNFLCLLALIRVQRKSFLQLAIRTS